MLGVREVRWGVLGMDIYRHSVSSWKIDQTETSWKLYGAILNGWKFIPSGWNFYPERLKLLSWTAETWNRLKPETTETKTTETSWNHPELPLNIHIESRLKVDCHPETSWKPSWTTLNDWKSVLKHWPYRPETSWNFQNLYGAVLKQTERLKARLNGGK